MNQLRTYVIGLVLAAVAVFLLASSYYTVSETEQVIITQFGKPSADPVRDAGLHFKRPFVQEVNRINKQILEWDGPQSEMPTRDKLYISVDTFARCPAMATTNMYSPQKLTRAFRAISRSRMLGI